MLKQSLVEHRNFEYQLLAKVLCELEQAKQTIILPSGTSAIFATIFTFAKPGTHLLICDNVYGPTRTICERLSQQALCDLSYFSPNDVADIQSHIKENTKLIVCETAGSWTYELINLPLLKASLAGRSIPIAIDNSWASPQAYKPLCLGADIVIESISKYIGGQDGLILGAIACNEEQIESLQQTVRLLGFDEGVTRNSCDAALRGVDTLDIRLDKIQRSSAEILHHLNDHSQVKHLYHPLYANSQCQEILSRDFKGHTGVFSLELFGGEAAAERLKTLRLFELTTGWGGSQSKAQWMPTVATKIVRTIQKLPDEWNVFRFSIGLENTEALIEDLTQWLSNREL
ncbi:trans-sulfuration enzyme family protein [Pseudoalteromonas sp. ASV78]|uniref:trans-sulfuration enzyme family protein n=1 Tax=Pseudoalteromonas sp. ASV78 TaxID=3397851 RepID=UPI0039FC8642